MVAFARGELNPARDGRIRPTCARAGRLGFMTPFAPPCPRRLRSTLGHAESFGALLSRLEVRRTDGRARAWLMGRRQEISCFVQQVVRDLRAKRVDETTALGSIEKYLATLHAGLATHFGDRSPTCCLAPWMGARSPFPRPLEGTPTTLYLPQRSANPAACATWIDVQPDELIAGLPHLTPKRREDVHRSSRSDGISVRWWAR